MEERILKTQRSVYAEVSMLYNVGRPTRLLCPMQMFRGYNIHRGHKGSTDKKGITITKKFNVFSPLLAKGMIGPLGRQVSRAYLSK